MAYPTAPNSIHGDADLLRNLLRKAVERRSLHLLAMAFRLRNPRWGSQSLLITQGLSGYLEFVNWKLDDIEYGIPDFLDVADRFYGPAMRALRLTQIRHLADLTGRDWTVTLRPFDDTLRSQELTALANQGLLLHELQAHIQTSLPTEQAARLIPLIQSLTVEDYVAAVHPDDQPRHPHRLDARITDYKRKVNSVACNYACAPLSSLTQGVTGLTSLRA